MRVVIILTKQFPYIKVGISPWIVLLLIYFTELKQKDWSCVNICFGILSPNSENVICSAITQEYITPFFNFRIPHWLAVDIHIWCPLILIQSTSFNFSKMICGYLYQFIQEVHSVSLYRADIIMGIWLPLIYMIFLFPKECGGTRVCIMFSHLWIICHNWSGITWTFW